MNIEERVRTAIEDLAGLLAVGESIESALVEAARDSNLKVEVLRVRAAKILGPLEEVAGKAALERKRITEHRIFDLAAEDYCDSASTNLNEFLMEKLGRKPTSSELSRINEDVPNAILRRIIRKLDFD